jgi:hypothetical protein
MIIYQSRHAGYLLPYRRTAQWMSVEVVLKHLEHTVAIVVDGRRCCSSGWCISVIGVGVIFRLPADNPLRTTLGFDEGRGRFK